MSDAAEPRTGHPDERHQLGELRGASVRGRVLELQGVEGSATVYVPDERRDAFRTVARNMTGDDACCECGTTTDVTDGPLGALCSDCAPGVIAAYFGGDEL
ncbi:hypothetical protein [Halarchaeum sp. P4]|uniref:hypothetical protein n=1 Tax=Halarchaeum sp. P4 TaxID=3421639 RepID=UPI003EBA3660